MDLCSSHPTKTAAADCATCGKHICVLCSFDVGRRAYCSECAVSAATVHAATPVPAPVPALVPEPAELVAAERTADYCAGHPEVEATTRCLLCAKFICATCDFLLPGGAHICPSCIEGHSSADVSPTRKRLSYIAMALASWSTILTVLLFLGVFNEMFTEDAAGRVADLIITNIILWPLLVGTALALSALDKRLTNTTFMKMAAWWNGVLGGIFLLFVIAANMGLLG